MLTIYNCYYKKIKQLYIIFCMLIHFNYNKNRINWAYLQHKWKINIKDKRGVLLEIHILMEQ